MSTEGSIITEDVVGPHFSGDVITKCSCNVTVNNITMNMIIIYSYMLLLEIDATQHNLIVLRNSLQWLESLHSTGADL